MLRNPTLLRVLRDSLRQPKVSKSLRLILEKRKSNLRRPKKSLLNFLKSSKSRTRKLRRRLMK